MTLSPLKKARLLAGKTQVEVAEAMGVSQPNYQRWEAGNASIPAGKIKKLAKVLETNVEAILGKAQAFDTMGIDGSISDSRTYFGEVAIHFAIPQASLLLPLSEEQRLSIHNQLENNQNILIIESLDNRIVFIRRKSIYDIYFSSEAYGDFGPEHPNYKHNLGILPNDDFWYFIENIEFIDDIKEEYEEERFNELCDLIIFSEEKLDQRIAAGDIAAEKREEIIASASKCLEKLFQRATTITWQLLSGQIRQENIIEKEVVYDTFERIMFDPDDLDDLIYLPIEGYHRSIFINKNSIDYISIPMHTFNEGSLKERERLIDRS
ncbi:MAG: helix-turn-helix transcriptional regulator [Gammaproteobacteria bacterium]|nr:helix-turn-helix transcriptional regulator [Gammaproteobacteria bacterium]